MKPLFLLPVLLTSTLLAQEPDSTSALFSMREAERNFARASVIIGRNAAFAEYFADESVLFTGKWITNGKEYSKNRKPAPVVLKWEPEFMYISESRDFGISTGPWEAQEYRPNTAPVATGYFLTVWKKQKNGEWQVILDGGSETPVIKDTKHNFTFPAGSDKPGVFQQFIDPGQSLGELMNKENSSHSEWKKDLGKGVRMQIKGHLPSTDPDTISLWISKIDKKIKWNVTGGGAAGSGDMGYTYGLLSDEKTGAVKGHYVKIWTRKPGDDWKISLEMLNQDN